VSDIKPFLATLAAAVQPRPLSAALQIQAVPAATSPWTPRAEAATSAPVAAPIDVDAIRAEAIAAGREEGLRESAQLRGMLRILVDALQAARDGLASPAADLIADAATAVVAAWTERGDRRELFAPIVRNWIARCAGEATAHVHPSDVDAMRDAIGAAPIAIVGDDTIPRGGVKIRGAALELAHAWEPRLRELREAIATALEAR
jgi:flagellar biosynthesis/type III secretory pathway protein FliH